MLYFVCKAIIGSAKGLQRSKKFKARASPLFKPTYRIASSAILV
jgi:hypothetical protein